MQTQSSAWWAFGMCLRQTVLNLDGLEILWWNIISYCFATPEGSEAPKPTQAAPAPAISHVKLLPGEIWVLFVPCHVSPPQPTWLMSAPSIAPLVSLCSWLEYFRYTSNINGETKESAWYSWKTTRGNKTWIQWKGLTLAVYLPAWVLQPREEG